jgi:hypothetical protein
MRGRGKAKSRQLLHAPSVIMVAISTVPVLIMWLRGESAKGASGSIFSGVVEALFFDGAFSVMLLILTVCMCIALYCVVCEVTNDSGEDDFLGSWAGRGRRGTRRRKKNKKVKT